jgi:4-hydroxy-3-methylbut-2-enyl diphosphate reductase
VSKTKLTIHLAAPRGFCAGVERAIEIVERALETYGPPVYVRHEIVHNRYVVDLLRAKGAVFIEELSEVPQNAPVIFSAHGVAKAVPAEAAARDLFYLDATCPLVSKVHREAERHHQQKRKILLIGHAGHPEVLGTLGQLPPGAISLIETSEDAEKVVPEDTENLAYVTQTTLSLEDTAEIIAILKRRFPSIQGPKKEDICYATTNRQLAVRALARNCQAIFVIGAPNSSNSLRLVEVAQRNGCTQATLLQRAQEIDWQLLSGVTDLGITAGASAPEILVEEVIDACRERFDVTLIEEATTQENVKFKLPQALSDGRGNVRGNAPVRTGCAEA